MVDVPYGANVQATVIVKNKGIGPGMFRVKGSIGGSRLFSRHIDGHPDNAAVLMAGVPDYVDVYVAPGHSEGVSMWTSPLWKPNGLDPSDPYYQVRDASINVTCLETGGTTSASYASAVRVYGYDSRYR